MEIPDFNELYRDYNDKGLEVLAISIDDGRDALLNFKNAYNIFILFYMELDLKCPKFKWNMEVFIPFP